VHLFGNVAPVAAIEALGVPVLEDAAQAAGSLGPDGRPGALGAAATFSFYPSKNLGAFGDGGAITTNDAGIADRARMLRFHGSRDKQTFEELGYNSRLASCRRRSCGCSCATSTHGPMGDAKRRGATRHRGSASS